MSSRTVSIFAALAMLMPVAASAGKECDLVTHVVSGIAVEFARVEVSDGETTRSLHVGTTEVTQELFEAVMGSNPSISTTHRGPKHPVEGVTFDEAVEFAALLGVQIGKPVRLPTVSEWNGLLRISGETIHADLHEYVVFRETSGGGYVVTREISSGGPSPVASHRRDPNCLFDFLGNVSEWVAHDGRSPDRVPYIGGHFGSTSQSLSRYPDVVDYRVRHTRHHEIGFRVVY